MPAQSEILTLAEAKQVVDKTLQDYCAVQRKKAESYDVTYARLWKVIDEYLQTGGKRIRPYLVLLTYQAYGGKDMAAITPVAAAWELLHACLLVHDDIIDKDTMRHGQLNIAGVYEQVYAEQLGDDTAHFAASAALLAGDLLLSGAHQLLLQADIPSKQKLQVSDLLSDALFGVGGGELLDVEAVFDDLAVAQPEKIAQYKTAEYSFEFPLVCGAMLADASEAEQKSLRELGKNVGIAFQLTDDMLGVFGNAAQTGKSTSTDIREQKRTLLTQETLRRLDNPQAERLRQLYAYGRKLTENEAHEAFDLIRASGARQVVEQRADIYNVKAKEVLRMLAISDAHKQIYDNLLDAMVRRAA